MLFRSDTLKKAGIEEARRELLTLMTHVTGQPLTRILAALDEPLEDGRADQFQHLAIRRAAREPLAYLIGHADFSGLELAVGPGVLVPRPDSETLVEAAAEALLAGSAHPKDTRETAPLCILDTCTGSGAIGIALAVRLHGSGIPVHLHLVDLSETALDFARRNVERYCSGFPVEIEQNDLFPAAPVMFDLITANPPYIEDSVLPGLMPEVSRYEPSLALSGGDDGLDVYRRILDRAVLFLKPGGHLLMEHGYDQALAVARLIRRTPGLTEPILLLDFGKNPRVTACRRSN